MAGDIAKPLVSERAKLHQIGQPRASETVGQEKLRYRVRRTTGFDRSANYGEAE
jgi:hypothetical protein